jgi:hypothetical protein
MTRKTSNRLRHDNAPEIRGERDSQHSAERADVNESLSDDDAAYLELIRNEFNQEALPQLKSPPGWHYCWLSTTASYDPIHRRLRLGYIPVKFDELRDDRLRDFKVTSGDMNGCVQCNEMLLCKIEERRYQMIMRELHDAAPRREEEAIKARAIDQSKRDKTGRQLIDRDPEDEGFDQLGSEPRPQPLIRVGQGAAPETAFE